MPPAPRTSQPFETREQYGPDPASAAIKYHRNDKNAQPSLPHPRQNSGIPSRPVNNYTQSTGHNPRSNVGANGSQTWFDYNSTAIPEPRVYTDGEPPFRPGQPGSSSSDVSSETNVPQNLAQHRPVAPFHLLRNSAPTETDSGDYRSIIDDLTVENRELKERLRVFEAAQGPSAEVQQDRLFEVKVHGLPTHQKHELVETLKAFAERVVILKDQSSQQASSTPYVSINRSVQPHGHSPSATSSRRLDLSYASASVSGQLSRTTPDPNSMSTPVRSTAQPIAGTPPDLLYGGYDPSMTEREKKVMVIKRLEQLFSGKGSRHAKSKKINPSQDSSTGFEQITDRMREAQILPSIENSEQDAMTEGGKIILEDDTSTQHGDYNEKADPQRETRLLDVDPDRVQKPEENIGYIRHLFGTSSKPVPEGTTEIGSISEWVYLNILFNLAQLHMFNVTPDFVRSAITEVSTRFELSEDRQKVRWYGGPDDIKSGSDSDRAMADATIDGSDSDSKLRKMGGSISTGTTGPHHHLSSLKTASSLNQPASEHRRRRHDLEYKPLFTRPRGFSDHSQYHDDAASGYLPRSTVDGEAYGSAIGTTMTGVTNVSRPRSDAGPIVFFSGALFVTDLSGDATDALQQEQPDNISYGCKRAPMVPLGAERPKRPRMSRKRSSSHSRVKRRPFKDYAKVAEALQQDSRLKTPERICSDDASSNDISFDLKWTDDGKSASPRQRIVMEASGLGGTKPDDNFVVIVETAHPKMRSEFHKQLQAHVASALDPTRKTAKLLHMIDEAKVNPMDASRRNVGTQPASQSRHEEFGSPPVKITVLSRRDLRLPPSETPPPAQLWYDDSDSDGESNHSMHSNSTDQMIEVLKNSPPTMNGLAGEEEEEEEDRSGDEDSDGEIDMMGWDRQANPTLVAERESSYERDLMRIAIVDTDRHSGSRAATVGDDEDNDEKGDDSNSEEEEDDDSDDKDDASMES